MSAKSAKRWFWWHKWSSLVCTLFLLLLCLTGLPLIFHHEIEELTEEKHPPSDHQIEGEGVSLDEIIRNGNQIYPDQVVRYVFWTEDEPGLVYLSLADSVNAPPDNYIILPMDESSGLQAKEPATAEGFMYIMLRLHVDLFAGIGGKLFMGLMGMLFVVSIISGVVLYGPIMKKYDFGMIRTHRSARLKWLDTHNFLGIVALVWTLVVGVTGVINTLSDVVLGLWQQGQLAEMTSAYVDAKPLDPDTFYSLDLAIKAAEDAAPDKKTALVAMPGTAFSSMHHYAVFLRGTTPLTSRLVMPALLDASTGELTDMRAMPWFVNVLFLSQPLHFGDYGGLTLKIIWAILDLVTILILVTGLYLWISRFRAMKTANITLKETKIKTALLHE
ncbi:putative iron-regulated membrane protein [Algoriphagus sp. 4150]|uniref:PepSY-associated TM helix domain-containing protein n=1 Tax=Algoriphagus sp. 4150 TaxID=2817756 RepID=UPI002864E8A0|nr:PepSY domain-containing protein [Algoriphagus sp. 4150]MDR7131453.1 putative iron-regulated membrane protein [Algoriphagus sp. 4150]